MVIALDRRRALTVRGGGRRVRVSQGERQQSDGLSAFVRAQRFVAAEQSNAPAQNYHINNTNPILDGESKAVSSPSAGCRLAARR